MKKIRRNIALGMITQNADIQYATEMDRDMFLGLKIGTPVEIKAQPDRNVKHHRKFFAMMKLGLEYWKPDTDIITAPERWIAEKVALEFSFLSQNQEFYQEYALPIANKVIHDVTEMRKKKIDSDAFHNIDLYRRKIMIDAGFFDYILLQDGSALREPHSIAFNKMSQDKFNEIYRGCFSQIWQQTLIQVFTTQIEAQNAIDEMMTFV